MEIRFVPTGPINIQVLVHNRDVFVTYLFKGSLNVPVYIDYSLFLLMFSLRQSGLAALVL